MSHPAALQYKPDGRSRFDTRYSVRERMRSRDHHNESFIIILREREKEQSIQ
jgi:hypothetical protein